MSLKERWEALKAENPRLRIRNAAEQLEVSEAELLVTDLGKGVTRLRNEFAAILQEVEKLGKVMGLTRNDECVHERKGVYLNGDFSNAHAQLFVGEDIDMRIFLSAWASAFAVADGDRKSLQFFGKDGSAIHKIYLTKDSNVEAFDALTEKYRSDDQISGLEVTAFPPAAADRPDNEIDAAGFQEAWLNLKDTHDFFGLLRKYGVGRVQALRLAPDEYHARKLDNSKVVELLERASKADFPIMVFVGNRGNIQIHTGEVNRLLWHESWINIMDPDFNLHLDTAGIFETWVVRKPTEDGVVTSVEAFNAKGEMIVQFFGKRKPGIPELPEWQELVKLLEA